VIVASSVDEACAAVDSMLVEGVFGDAGGCRGGAGRARAVGVGEAALCGVGGWGAVGRRGVG